ncbi:MULTISPECIES: hypothetical protein [Rhodopseudomonas]|uniref:Uncharacterized protein n=1 Tax=Rhodopseudomonas palustris TaxID=1076 RepID=A0A0D7ELK3_RHOPL|nr:MULTISPECIES: hypothetical protein [Rhodopseudomonas]KIZ41430.1 hypothetical protein OO17_15100 [Rhodopseudomonas palustris]MDF3810066.1 hypothetical protein [Rhodopseudomonas sp. BAL398]WOK18743.1 hypothetical protein RBJ75_04225 [Rhodopseudomonas sp. BAL398]
MATLGEFSSLLQLGFGIGIGLSYFRAPVELRAKELAMAIDNEIIVLEGLSSAKAQQQRGDLSLLKLAFNVEADNLEKWLFPFMIGALVGAVGNWTALVLASLYAPYVLSAHEKIGLLFLSVAYYLILGALLEIMARWRFHIIKLRLAEIRST